MDSSFSAEVYDASNNLLAYLHGDRKGYIVQSAVYYHVVFTTSPFDGQKGFKAAWTETTTEHARVGGYATLSWTLPEPGTRELSVCNTETKKCLLHVTGYNDIRAASDKWTSRVRFIGKVSSSGTGLFRFTLSSVTWEDAGLYQCYRGAPDSRGPAIPNCGQKLLLPVKPIHAGITVNGTGNVIVNENETVSFQCDVHSIPPPSSIHVQQKETNSIHDLVIKDINCTHTGTYACVARNVVGVTTGKETVTINVISQPRRCDSSDKYLAMSYDSQSVSGTFLVCSYPEPVNHIMEYLDKGINVIDMSDSPRHNLYMHKGERFYMFMFSISKMQTRDLGTYRLSVVNEKGTLELFVQLFDQGTTTTTTTIAITSFVTLFITAAFITVAFVVFRRLKKSHERRAASPYISPIGGVFASAGRAWYNLFYADIGDSEVQGNLPGPRQASNSSSPGDDYEVVGQAVIAVHLQPGNQQPIQVADIQVSNIDEHEPPQAQQCSSHEPDAPATVESIFQLSAREKPDSASATPYYLCATEDKTSPQPSSSKTPDTANATSTTKYYLTATEDKTSPQPSSSMTPDAASATSATPST